MTLRCRGVKRARRILSRTMLLVLAVACSELPPDRAEDLKAKAQTLASRESTLQAQEHSLDVRERAIAQRTVDGGAMPLSQLYLTLKPAVFVLYVKGDSGIAQGSGFLISPDGLAVSNYHVLANAQDAIAILDDSLRFMIGEVLDSSEARDYVLFRLAGSTATFPFVTLASTSPAIGEDCFAIGNPEGLRQTLSTGIISGYREDPQYGELIQTTADITHGSSGGPLFNRAGEVIGVTTMGFEQGNLNFAIGIRNIPINRFLQGSRVAITASTLTPVPVEATRSQLTSYYTTVFSRDYEALGDFYAPILDRYFGQFNVPRAEVIRLTKEYWVASGILTATNTIHWDTFMVVRSPDGGLHLSYSMDYVITRTDRAKPTRFQLNMFVEMTEDLKIRGIYEDIISKR